MKARSPTFKTVPLGIVGSTVFGRYPKISVEQTFNMIISDGWLVDYAGYANVLAQNAQSPLPAPINGDGVGRGAFHSTRLNKVIVAVFNGVYLLTITNVVNQFPLVSVSQIGTLNTFSGDVFIAEDNQGNVAICDKTDIWIYNPATLPPFQKATIDGTNPLDFTPGYICFHHTRFISVDLKTSQWRLSDPLSPSNNHRFPNTSQFVGQFQSKPDIPVAVLPFPGKESLIFLIGSNVTQLWTDVGGALFPYQLSTGVNIDFGCLNADTVATLDNIVCWLGGNDRAGPVILYSIGGLPQKISTDGIDFRLSNLTNPSDAHGFMFRQDGHTIYQLCFPTDNFSLIYDFNTQKFFTVTDEKMNYHIAKKTVYVNNTYYFISLNDGNFYQFDTSLTNYNYGYNSKSQLITSQIPRIRFCPTYREKNTAPFVVNNFVFPIEQGISGNFIDNSGLATEDLRFITTESGIVLSTEFVATTDTRPVVDLSVSIDGGYTFSNYDRMIMSTQGNYKNRFIYYGIGWCNEMTPQFRFWSNDRFVVGEGTMDFYQ